MTPGSGGTPLTCLTLNEIRRMHAIFCRPAHPLHTTSTGHDGANATKPSPANAITSGEASEITN